MTETLRCRKITRTASMPQPRWGAGGKALGQRQRLGAKPPVEQGMNKYREEDNARADVKPASHLFFFAKNQEGEYNAIHWLHVHNQVHRKRRHMAQHLHTGIERINGANKG